MTVTVAEADTLPAVAVTVATPRATARTTPNSSGEATEGFEDVQLAATRRDDPSEYCAVTDSVSDDPETSCKVSFDSVIPLSVTTGVVADGAVGVTGDGDATLKALARSRFSEQAAPVAQASIASAGSSSRRVMTGTCYAIRAAHR